VAQGFEAQGNEFSYYMLIASAFVLNSVEAPGQWTVFPWVHNACNQPLDADQLRPVRAPDPDPEPDPDLNPGPNRGPECDRHAAYSLSAPYA
jgi:hypothetical protein